jgi:hypothetical protein
MSQRHEDTHMRHTLSEAHTHSEAHTLRALFMRGEKQCMSRGERCEVFS